MKVARLLLLLACGCASAVPMGSLARAEDAAPAHPPSEVRVHPVGVLLRGHPWFSTDRGPFPSPPDQINDEKSPLFGDEGDVTVRPEVRVEALVERLKAATGLSDGPEAEGVAFGWSSNRDLLFVEAPARVQERVGELLAAWAREACATLVLDVAWLEGDAEAARGAGGLAAAVSAGALRPIGFARILPTTRGTGVARDGRRTAFLQDYDTEIGCACNVPDPIIGVAMQGLAARAAAMPTAQGRWSVHLQGWWADEPTLSCRRMVGGFHFEDYPVGPRVPTPEGGDVFEMVSVDGEAFRVPLVLAEGVWELVPLSGRRVIAARLRVLRVPGPDARAEPPAAMAPATLGERYGPTEPPAPLGALVTRSMRLDDLLAPGSNARGRSLRIVPSNYYPPYPPDPSPAEPLLTAQDLQWILGRAVAPAPADAEGTWLRIDGGRLAMRSDAARAASVERVLGELREKRGRTTHLEATVIALPLASLPEAWSDPDAAAVAGVGALLARPGARRLQTLELDLRDGQRGAVLSGEERAYLKDYDVELACTTTIGKPIVGRLFEGVSLDVECVPVHSSPWMSLLVRLDRSALRGMRSVSTRFGDIEAPTMLEQSLRGAVTLAPGETRLFGLSASGPEATLVLLHVAKR